MKTQLQSSKYALNNNYVLGSSRPRQHNRETTDKILRKSFYQLWPGNNIIYITARNFVCACIKDQGEKTLDLWLLFPITSRYPNCSNQCWRGNKANFTPSKHAYWFLNITKEPYFRMSHQSMNLNNNNWFMALMKCLFCLHLENGACEYGPLSRNTRRQEA